MVTVDTPLPLDRYWLSECLRFDQLYRSSIISRFRVVLKEGGLWCNIGGLSQYFYGLRIRLRSRTVGLGQMIYGVYVKGPFGRPTAILLAFQIHQDISLL